MNDFDSDEEYGVGHNSASDSGIDRELLKFVAEFEDLDERKNEINEDAKDLRNRIADAGYDPKVVKDLVRFRGDVKNQTRRQAVLRRYIRAIGLEPPE